MMGRLLLAAVVMLIVSLPVYLMWLTLGLGRDWASILTVFPLGVALVLYASVLLDRERAGH